MALRVQFLSASLGPYIEETADPIGINELTRTTKRSSDNDGVIYEIILDLQFIKKSRSYIKTAYEQTGGIDAIVTVNIYEYDPNARRWRLYYTGIINYNKFDLFEDTVTVTLEQTGFQTRVLNLIDTDVDLETVTSENGQALPAPDPKSVLFHSKKLFLQLVGTGPVDQEITFDYLDYETPTFLIYLQFAIEATIDEIKERFNYPLLPSILEPKANKKYNFLLDTDINLTFDLRVTATVSTDRVNAVSYRFGFYLSYGKNGVYTDVIIAETTAPDLATDIEIDEVLNLTVPLLKDDEVYLYSAILTPVLGLGTINYTVKMFKISGMDQIVPTFNISGLSSTPDSLAKSILIHEAFQRCCQYITNQTHCFKSDLLGRTDITLPDGSTYAEDGQGSLIAITNGKNLRGNPQQIFASLKSLLEFVNACFCTGFGFEYVNGVQILRVEKKSFFYNKTTKILSLGRVYKPRRKVDSKRFFNQIEYGYIGKIDIGQVNAIDEFNTVRRSSIPIVNTKNTMKVSTKMIAGGYPIEYQRRLINSTEDGKLDDQNFAAVLVRDGVDFKTKKDEGYTVINNVIDPGSGYNYDISPARCLQEWRVVLASGVIRSLNKILKFTFGEVNFIMSSQKTTETTPLAENGSVDLTGIEPLWDNEIYPLKNVPFSREYLDLVKATPYGYIDFEDKSGELMEGYIESIDHDPNKGTADLELLRVHRPT